MNLLVLDFPKLHLISPHKKYLSKIQLGKWFYLSRPTPSLRIPEKLISALFLPILFTHFLSLASNKQLAREMPFGVSKIRYVFLLDTSESMIFDKNKIKSNYHQSETTLFEEAKQDILSFAKNAPKDIPFTVHVMPFDRGIQDRRTFEGSDGHQYQYQLKEYLDSLKATGQKTYIYSSLKSAIQFCSNEDETSHEAQTTIWVLTDGVDNEQNPRNLNEFISLFREYRAENQNKPWIVFYRKITNDTDTEGIGRELARLNGVPGISINNTPKDNRLLFFALRIRELEFGYWKNGSEPITRSISFESLNPSRHNQIQPSDSKIIIELKTDKQKSGLSSGEDVQFPKITINKSLAGSRNDFIQIHLKPILINNENLNKKIEGILHLNPTREDIIFVPDKIPFRLHIGERPAIAITKLTQLNKEYLTSSIPSEEHFFFKVTSKGNVQGGLNSIEATFLSEIPNDRIGQEGSPQIQLADASGYASNDWDALKNWKDAEYMKITVPYSHGVGEDHLEAFLQFHAKGHISFLENDQYSEKIKFQINIDFITNALKVLFEGKPLAKKSLSCQWPSEFTNSDRTTNEPLVELEINTEVPGSSLIQVEVQPSEKKSEQLFIASNFSLFINGLEVDSWRSTHLFEKDKPIELAFFAKKDRKLDLSPDSYPGRIIITGGPEIPESQEIPWVVSFPKPPDPWWVKALKIIGLLIILGALAFGVWWAMLPSFKPARLDLHTQDTQGKLGVDLLESYHLKGKRHQVIGNGGLGLREFAARIKFRPGKKDGAPVLFAKSLSETIKLFIPDNTGTENEVLEHGELNPNEEIRVYDQYVLGFEDYGFRINGMAYQQKDEQEDSYSFPRNNQSS